jgi:transcriptional regulator with XRE-family HTH domain
MTDSKRLKDVVKASGLKKKFIAERIGVSYRSYLNKENGISQFYSDEICIIKDLLRLTVQEATEIFFAS